MAAVRGSFGVTRDAGSVSTTPASSHLVDPALYQNLVEIIPLMESFMVCFGNFSSSAIQCVALSINAARMN